MLGTTCAVAAAAASLSCTVPTRLLPSPTTTQLSWLTVLHGAHGVVVLAHNHKGVQPLVADRLLAALLLREGWKEWNGGGAG